MIYLAPIQGITDRIFRNVFPKFFQGIDIAIAPFISTSKRKNPEKVILRELNPEINTGIPVIPQILSSDPDDFIPLSDRLYESGYRTVNWNLGCPFPAVVKKGKGAGMLCYPRKIEEFLDKAIPRMKIKLSIKLRTCFFYPDEILSLIPVFNNYPLE
jgi:tRNA-dihydrouridine synthase